MLFESVTNSSKERALTSSRVNKNPKRLPYTCCSREAYLIPLHGALSTYVQKTVFSSDGMEALSAQQATVIE
jgi:hypothetical protein